MANLNLKKDGGYAVQFTISRTRWSVYLGKISKGDAEYIEARVEEIESAKKYDQPLSSSTHKWISSLPDKLHAKFADKGLFAPRVTKKIPENRLSVLLAAYRSKKVADGVKPKTLLKIDHLSKSLRAFFPKDPLITEIDHEMAKAWRNWMKTNGNQKNKSGQLAWNTVRRRTGNAKELFNYAIEREWISKNPFKKLPSTVRENEERKQYVSLDVAEKVLACLPSNQWRLVFGLARYAGLRCPSEVKALRWSDVDLETGWIWVTCIKTEGHEGHERRRVPIIGPLLPLLQEEEKSPGAEIDGPVINMHGDGASEAVYRQGLLRYLKRATIKPWGKLFQNLRVSFENDLFSVGMSVDTIGKLMGHSPEVALRHYAMFRELECGRLASKGFGADQFRNVLQKVLQSEAVSSDSEVVTENADSEENQGNDDTCVPVTASDDSQEEGKNGRRGTRIVIKSTAFHGVSPVDSANCSALPTQHPLKELLEIAERLGPSQQQKLLTYARSLTRSVPVTETVKRINVSSLAGFLTEVAQ